MAADGDDSNDGTIDSPFATIEKARDTLRKMKKNDEINDNGAVVYLRGGTYSQTKTVDFTSADSGEAGAPVVYRAYPGEEVKIVGGASIPLDEVEKVTDENVLSRLIDSNAKNNLYRVSFSDAGIDSDTALLYLVQSYGSFSNAIEGKKPGWGHYGEELKEYFGLPKTRSTPIKLLADDTKMEVARYPDSGLMKVQTPISQYSIMNNSEVLSQYGYTGEADLAETRYLEMLSGNQPAYPSFIPDDTARAKKWAGRQLKNVILSGNIAYGWSTECLLLKEVKSDGTIVSQNATFYQPITKGDPFYIYNFFDEISENEFYFDMDGEYLYMCLPKTPTEYNDISISLLETPIFDIKNVSYMDIKDIHFTFSAGEAMSIADSSYVVADGCEVSHTMKANKAMTITGKSDHCGIKNSYFHNVNGGVVIETSSKSADTRAQKLYNFFNNNEVEEFSEIDKTQIYALKLGGTGNEAKYNKIHGGDFQAVGFSGRLNTLSNNEIYDVCRNTDDAGAIYAAQTWTSRGGVLSNNYIHDLGESSGGSGYGVHGIYFDDGFSRADVVGNVLENIPGYGVFLGGGNGNGIYNNVIVNSGNGIWCDERCYDTNGATYKGRVENYYAYGDVFSGDDVKALWPDLENMNFDEMRKPANTYDRNVIYKSGKIVTTDKATEYGTFGVNLITSDNPGFASLASRNYTLDKNSYAAQQISGFSPVMHKDMGLLTDRILDKIEYASVFAIGSPIAFKNGTEVKLNNIPTEYKGKIYLPLNLLAEANCCSDFGYDETSGIASLTADGTTVVVNTNTRETTINSVLSDKRIRTIIVNGAICLPVGEISSMLGNYVYTDDRGVFAVSSDEQLFDADDSDMIDYLCSRLCIN